MNTFGLEWAGGRPGAANPDSIKTGLTALFCGTDRTAMGAYDAIRDLGLSIPGDVSVVGFDNQEIVAAYLRPKLTSVALPHQAMSEWAVNYLLEHYDTPEAGRPTQQLMECPLVERASIQSK